MKIVPDPPASRPSAFLQTAQSPFGSCNNAHESLFHVNSGVIAEDALIHLSRHLQTAFETATRIYNVTPMLDTGLHWSTVWAVDAARALIEALLKGADDVVLPPKDAEGGLFIPGTIRTTAEQAFGYFGACDLPMFSVRSGVLAEDVLVHVSLYLQAAYTTANEVCMLTPQAAKGLHWATLHAIEAAMALTEGLLEGSDKI
ncbi:hypothetical protein [Pseudomonas sp. R5(2019)]|uniref:hypothetical protein n=1 Tax=Pseudomonas sp. R5(2019) TaxID=2697566 RepID=UPI0014128642|nr:hypothetical protein [Pseudomonas sp. R5(2019)]NBA98134.1 hypothetical protein [Pseudomonas sp. R5(2019)]